MVKGGTGYAIGYTQEGEWLEYTVKVDESGEYSVSASYATSSENAGFNLYVDDEMVLENIVFPQGSDWETYATFDAGKVKLLTGEHVLKLEIVGNYANIDWLDFGAVNLAKGDSTAAITVRYRVDFGELRTYGVYGLDGRLVAKFSAATGENLQAKTAAVVKRSGMYLVKSRTGGRVYRVKVSQPD